MKNNISIRKAEKGDEKTFAYIQTESWKKAFSSILSKENLEKYTDINHAAAMYKKVIEQNQAQCYLLSIDDKPHCIACYSASRDKDMKGYAELICIHSLCDNWRKGYGSIMMNFILDKIRQNDFDKVMLWVFKDNFRARNFYENRGFNITHKSHMFSNAEEIMYVKNL